jgi:acyl-CoA reductase-like NAD-dependent aldehyde dehydrogenase
MMVTKSREADLLAAIKKEHQHSYSFSANIKKGDIAKIVNANHYQRLSGALAKSQGKVEVGGNRAEQDELLDITVVSDVTWDDELMKGSVDSPSLAFAKHGLTFS